ncbi:aquaporin-like protein [Hyaloscypha variabilis]
MDNNSTTKTHSLGNWTSGSRNTIRNHFVAMTGEFIGTFFFLFCSFAPTQIAVTALKNGPSTGPVIPDTSALFFIAASFGVAVTVNVWAFYRINGGMLNPAVTLGLVLIGAVPPIRGLLVFPCQMLAGIAAAGVVSGLFPGPLLVNLGLDAGTSVVQGLFIEMFLTTQFLIVIFLLAVEKHRATFLAPVGIGMTLFICHMSAVYYTGCGVNPARAFGPDVVNAHFSTYHWIYWLGPFLGAFLAAGIYKLFKILGYETANPGQDGGKEVVGLLYSDVESAVAASGEVQLRCFQVKRPVGEIGEGTPQSFDDGGKLSHREVTVHEREIAI